MFFSTCFSTNSKNYSRIEIASPLGLVLCHKKLTSTNGLVSYLHKDDLPTEAYGSLQSLPAPTKQEALECKQAYLKQGVTCVNYRNGEKKYQLPTFKSRGL